MMIYKNDLYSDCASLDKTIQTYSGKFGIYGHSNYRLRFLA